MSTILDKRARRGWYIYDWANSAFATVILAALLPVYLSDAVVPAEGINAFGLNWSATSLWGYVSGLSALFIFLLAPFLGAHADLSGKRRRWLLSLFMTGALSTVLLIFVGPGDVALALVLYLIAASTFVAANIFYDSFLPHLGTPSERDGISARGYALGYLGGGIMFLLALLMVEGHAAIGLTKTWAVRVALSSVGVWWGGFGLVAWRRMAEPDVAASNEDSSTIFRQAWQRVLGTTKEILGRRRLAFFLLAFLFYNDGIQTVVKMAAIYGAEELGFETSTLLGTLLLVQFVGILGALLFGMLARKMGTKPSLMLSLVLWIGIVIWGYMMSSPREFWILGAAVGLCLGGSQALSRSYFTRFIPVERSSEYFGFYSVFAKFSAVGGPILFAIIRQSAGSARLSILCLGLFFIIGLVFLSAMGRTPDDASPAAKQVA